uniref:UV radiation resistance-associated gene protein n=2 Tax=Kalanchoe fedtschenkoi TaxID=63787 RepID=A0A7N1A429_KALFE
MESDRRIDAKSKAADAAAENVNVIQWEDFEHEVVRFCSLKSALAEAEERKRLLKDKLEALIQVKAESQNRLNELDEMHEKLKAKKLALINMSTQVNVAAEDARKQEGGLGTELRSLLVAGTALSVARKGLEESNRKLVEEEGYVDLKNLQRKLRLRQWHMVSQVSFLHRVRVIMGPAQEQELESFPSINRLGTSVECKPPSQGVLTISGLQLNMLPFKQLSFFTDKKEVQRTATALGYVAHAVLLVASYLKVHLRYPIRLGGSRSYITDPAPSVDSYSSDSMSNTASLSNVKAVELPLFLEGQDTTRAAYAVFLLNKDLEQLLNFIGVKSLGPRHVLANLKELYRTITSPEYLDS